MKFLVPNYSCLQNPRLGGYSPSDPRSLCPQLNLLNPPPEQNSWVRHCQQDYSSGSASSLPQFRRLGGIFSVQIGPSALANLHWIFVHEVILTVLRFLYRIHLAQVGEVQGTVAVSTTTTATVPLLGSRLLLCIVQYTYWRLAVFTVTLVLWE